MELEIMMIAERAEIDMICEMCHNEITIGEDFFYDHTSEEVYCENCASKSEYFELKLTS